MTMLLTILTVALVALQVGDVVSTNRVMAKGGTELNPVMALSMRKLGRLWWVPKAALATFGVWLTWAYAAPPYDVIFMGVLVAVFSVVLAFNLGAFK